MIGILDYGAGNLHSVRKALDFLGVQHRIVQQPSEMDGLEKAILPGVGAFEASMVKLHERGLVEPTVNWIRDDRPFLGICVGMQMLFTSSEENPGVAGLDVFPGEVRRFDHRKVPQIGWNKVYATGESPLLKGIDDGAFFYFLHSYYCKPKQSTVESGRSSYGIEYTSMLHRGNTHAVQFHPEKSAANGLKLLQNWVEL